MSDPIIKATLTGDRDIVAAFKDLRDYLPKNALRSSVRAAAEFLQGFIVLVAPKLTGKLARNIAVRTHATASTIRGRVVVNTSGGGRNDPDNAFYWRFLEEGFHTKRGEFLKYPFVAGVFDSKNRESAQTVIDSCEKAIDRAEAKARRSA